MNNLNLDVLENIPENNIAENINYIFDDLLKQLHSYLNLDIINSQVKIKYVNEGIVSEKENQDVLDLGGRRYIKDKSLVIEILDNYKKYLPIILLREAYYCFVPEILKDNETIKVFINQIIENNLQKLDVIKEWKLMIRNAIVNYDFFSAELDRIEKFLKLQGSETIKSGCIFFFEYIRRNIHLIDDITEDFYDNIKKEFILKSSKSLNHNEIIETLYVLIKIFYKVKSYRALSEYKKYFKELKENREILTELSLRKFTENLQWINKSTYIAPSYQVNWKAINVGVIFCKLRFNPTLEKTKVDLVVEKLPFFIQTKSSESNFAVEVSGWLVVPRVYLKDVYYFLEKLNQHGYTIDKTCILYNKVGNDLNLNYFRDFHNKNRIVNPNHKKYEKKYEINFELEHGQKFHKQELSILEFLILDRIRYWSITGFSFEKRDESLRLLKTDLINDISSERFIIEELKKNLDILQIHEDLKVEFLNFININQKFGFFYIKDLLKNLLISLNYIEKILTKNPSIKNVNQLKEYIKKHGISELIDENIIFNKNDIKKLIFYDLIPYYFQNKKEFNNYVKIYEFFNNFFKICSSLKIFDLEAMKKIVQNKNIVEKIYTTKEKKLKKTYDKYKRKRISRSDIEDILDNFLNKKPPIIKPILITTINTTSFSKYFIQLILKNSPDTIKILKKIRKFFPRITSGTGMDLFTKEDLIHIEIYLPNLDLKEKEVFISIMYNLFEDQLIILKRYYWDGFHEAYSRKNFYDFERNKFFYTKDLFNQFFKYVQKIFGVKLSSFKENSKKSKEKFWYSHYDMNYLIEMVNNRTYRQKIDLNFIRLTEILKLHLNLENIILNPENYKAIKKREFFKNYVKSIEFKPNFQAFGLGEYYLYIRPTDLNEIDFQLLLNNTFQSIRYPGCIDNSKSFLIKYIFPYRNFNSSYINWLTKSKKIISEYCLFFIKRIHQIFHLDFNLSSKGWDLDPNRFKTYMQKILFNPDFKDIPSIVKRYNLGDLKISNYYGPDSSYFKNLSEIYGLKSIDIKSVLGTKNYSIIEKILNLVKNKLIFPIIKTKNLDIQNKIYIILPNIKQGLNNVIIKIFSFFNFGFIYEIEGEIYIYGFPDIVKFENGLFIKLYLPSLDISVFQRLFDKLFNFLNIKKYLILTDMVDGKNLLKNIFGNLRFFELYNPLKNLNWNDNDKIWMNHKLFNEKFEPLYPNLI